MLKIGTHPRFSLPFAAVVVVKGETETTPDPLVNVPRFKRDYSTGQDIRLSHEERVALAAEYASKRETKAKKKAKVAAYNSLSSEAKATADAKHEASKAKRAATKAAKEAAKPKREPHTFVKLVKPQARFIPPPTLDKPMMPVPLPKGEETSTRLESEEARLARKKRLDDYKAKGPCAWLTESNSQRKAK